MNAVCVFCGSAAGSNPAHAAQAQALGALFAREGITLVYGGGHIGMMGVVADAALGAGGKVIGVIPRFMIDRELAHRGLTELIVVESMHARKAVMAELGEAFIAMPGGYGTCDELFEILTWRQLSLHDHPIVLLNDGYFDLLIAWLDRAAGEGLLRPTHRAFLRVGSTPEEVLQRVREA